MPPQAIDITSCCPWTGSRMGIPCPTACGRFQVAHMHITRVAIATLVISTSCLLSGCFSTSVRWWGNSPSRGVKVAAATADVITAPVQLPALALEKIKHPPQDPQVVAEREAMQRKLQEERLASARSILNGLKQNPEFLTDDTFWNRQSDQAYITSLGLIWFLQEPDAPASAGINTYLLKRFPEQSGLILANGRASQSELVALAGDTKQPYATRENALDALLRDPTFDFTAPWRQLVFDEFNSKIPLMFGTRRFTRQDLLTLAHDPKMPKWIQQMAADNLARNYFKPAP
ncbi:MAG: hypothetical protein WC205_19610 [Opitutaceae bacterium]